MVYYSFVAVQSITLQIIALHKRQNLLKARRTKCIKHIFFTHNLITWSLSAKRDSVCANNILYQIVNSVSVGRLRACPVPLFGDLFVFADVDKRTGGIFYDG